MSKGRDIKFRAWDNKIKAFHYWSSDFQLYTELKDKNGKEIYEGDIIETEYFAKGIVIWDDVAANFAFNCDEPMWAHPVHVMNGDKEVIGNIHENPELL